MSRKINNYSSYIGQKFNKLKILEIDEIQKYRSPNSQKLVTIVKVKAECECGNVIVTRLYDITKRRSTQCKNCRNNKSSAIFKEVNANKNFNSNQNHNWRGVGVIPRAMITQIQCGAKARNIEYRLSDEYLLQLFLGQKQVCPLTGVTLCFPSNRLKMSKDTISNKASLDRIDSSKGYVPGNVWWISVTVNLMKHAFTLPCFIKTCKLISDRYTET